MPFQDKHMDDLFRMAAENMPLKDADSDWDFISAQLNMRAVRPQETNNNPLFFFISLFAAVLMLTPLWLFDTIYQRQEGVQIAKKSASEKDSIFINQTVLDATPATTKQKENIDQLFNVTRFLIAEEQQKVAAKNAVKEFQEVYQAKVSTVQKVKEKNAAVQPGMVSALTENKRTDVSTDDLIKSELAIDVEKIALSESASLPDSPISQKPLTKKMWRWYSGVHIGTSFSSVKGQQITKPGFTGGITLGYKLSTNWALETGLRFSEKKYFSKGEYFKPKAPDPNMPADMKVLSMNSNTLLLEIPLKIKYDFLQTIKSRYFFAGGVNTFIVGKEINDYILFRNGINSEMKATYNANKSYLAATFELSAGYEKILKNKHILRIEPWVQIAQKGIGVGQLPVSGLGLQVGYFFHK